MEEIEIWKDIKDYKGLYKVSNYGNIYSVINKKLMMPTNNGKGYLIVGLSKKGRKNKYVHRLVADAFLENKNQYKYVNHKDYDTFNNKVENLEWCSQKYNINYSKDRMKHENINNKTKSTTGHKYIYWREKNKCYRVKIINHGEKYFKNLNDAIKYRDKVLKTNANYFINKRRT